MTTALAAPARHSGITWLTSVDTRYGPVRVTSYEQPDGKFIHQFTSRHVRGRVHQTKLKARNYFPLEFTCTCPAKNGTCFHGKASNDAENIIAESQWRQKMLLRGIAHNGEDLDLEARQNMGYTIGVGA